MDYVEQWYQGLMASRYQRHPLKRQMEAWGEYHKHLGPRISHAKVKIALGPSETLEVQDRLDPAKRALLDREGCYDQIAFGALDVMMTSLTAAAPTFALTILDIEYDEINSSAMAFRLAARDATRKIVDETTGGG